MERCISIIKNTQTTIYAHDDRNVVEEWSAEFIPQPKIILTWVDWTLLDREIFTGTTSSRTFRYTWGLYLRGDGNIYPNPDDSRIKLTLALNT